MVKIRRDSNSSEKQDVLKTSSPSKSISAKASTKGSIWFLVIFFGVFILMGGGFCWGFFVRPVLKIQEAKSWTETPCTIISSKVESHRGSDSTTYSVSIHYSYQFKGKEYKSGRYSFVTGSSSGSKGKRVVVKAHKPGSKKICYVDPANPYEAVMQRNMTLGVWLGLIPIVFVLVGLAGMFFGIRAVLRKKNGKGSIGSSARRGSTRSQSTWEDRRDTGSRELKSKGTPMAKFIGFTFAALFWNGIVSVFVWQAIMSVKRGRPEWFLIFFMIPFVLIGGGIIIGAISQLLALFNPRPSIVVTPGAVHLGEDVDLQWKVTGKVRRIRKMTIKLVGTEQATYRRGTNTHTDTTIFAEHLVMETDNYREMVSGEAVMTIHPDTMHSFDATNNKIIWMLKVEGDIPKWPDVNQDFVFTILPIETEGGRA